MFRVFSRYFLVQLLAYGLDIGGFVLLSSGLGIHPLTANIVGKVAAGTFAFLAHRHFTFEAVPHASFKSQLLRYALLLALNVPLSSAILALLLPVFPWAAVGKVAADALCIGLTFFLSKRLVFSDVRAGRR